MDSFVCARKKNSAEDARLGPDKDGRDESEGALRFTCVCGYNTLVSSEVYQHVSMGMQSQP